MSDDLMPCLWRKRPVAIYAIPLTRETWKACLDFLGDDFSRGNAEAVTLGIRTLEGVLTASPGDYIVRGVKGEHYAVKPDIFLATYDREPAQPEGAATTGADITDAMAEAFLDTWCQREKPTGEEWSISVIYGVKEGLAAAHKARTG